VLVLLITHVTSQISAITIILRATSRNERAKGLAIAHHLTECNNSSGRLC
jgi:hypothetical protein